MTDDDLYATHAPATIEARDRAWSSWGAIDPYAVTPISGSAFAGAWRVVRRDGGVLVASDGLADPMGWDNAEPTNGYAVEVYGITGDDIGDDGGVMRVGASWLGWLVKTVSNRIGYDGFQFTEQLQHWGTLTFGCSGDILPRDAERFVGDDGSCVLMLGLTDPELPGTIDGPLSPIRLVNVKLLTAREAEFCVRDQSGSGEARAELARRFAEQGDVLWSSLGRASVV